jgi:SAM-dependent methyltransferase
MNRKSHWDRVYSSKAETEVSWYQAEPKLSLELIREFCPSCGSVIDVGGGASLLVDRLLAEGFSHLSVLDISEAALERAKGRLGARSDQVKWIVGDVTEVRSVGAFDVWHDRAVFHFLTDPTDRQKYTQLALRTLSPGGHLILATFAPDGPTRCSGLDICRYDAEAVLKELGDSFSIVKELRETHTTPAGRTQNFFYGVFRRA